MDKLKEIERLAFLKYRLCGKKAMNTFLFSQARLNKLTDKEIDALLKNINKRIKEYQKQESNKVNFTCNI